DDGPAGGQRVAEHGVAGAGVHGEFDVTPAVTPAVTAGVAAVVTPVAVVLGPAVCGTGQLGHADDPGVGRPERRRCRGAAQHDADRVPAECAEAATRERAR